MENLQHRGISLVQQLFENLTSDFASVSELIKASDQDSVRFCRVLGSLLSHGLIAQSSTPAKEAIKEEKFLVFEISVIGVDGKLRDIAEKALTIQPNFSYTLAEVSADTKNVMGTGYFKSCQVLTEETRDGMVLRIQVEPNPEVKTVISTGGNALPQVVFEREIKKLMGKALNNNVFLAAISTLNEWYASNGVYGEVYDAYFEEKNTPVLKIAEAVVNRIDLRYWDAKTGDVKEEGNVKPEVILRHLGTKVGSVWSSKQAQRDLEAIYATGLFDDVKLIINVSPTSIPEQPKIDFLLDVYENQKTGGLGLGAGWSGQSLTEGSLPGFVCNVEYLEKNMFGLGQRLVSRMEVGQVDKLFKVEYTEPWIVGDKKRTSRTFGVMNTRSSGNPFYAVVEAATGTERSKTVIGRLMSSCTMSRALTQHWSGTLGLTAQRITLMDDNSRAIRQDAGRAPVNVSGELHDIMIAPFLKAAFSGWANTHLMLSAEKALPLKKDWVGITKGSIRAEKVTRIGPFILVLCAKGGATLDKVPPYEAFPLGGINSIRGYREGSVGTARHYAEGTAEIRVPIVSNLQGTLFADCGSDLGTGSSVIGNPGSSRGKPGKGAGFGAGVRVDSPVGPLRLEWAWNDKGARLFHAGFGDHR